MKNAIQYTYYHAADGWRWRGKRNGKITSESGEAYKLRSSAKKSLLNMLLAIEEGRYEVNEAEYESPDEN